MRILREVEGGGNIVVVCREHTISEVTFHRWKRQFAQLDFNEGNRKKELERDYAKLKKMLVDSLLKNRVLEAVNARKWLARSTNDGWSLRGRRRPVLGVGCVPGFGSGAVDFPCRMRPPTAELTWLVKRLHELSRKFPRDGFRRIVVKLRQEGYQVGRKHVNNLRRTEGLRVPSPGGMCTG
ncbi:MAG: transposase [Opitutaceae bacterium]